MVFFLNDVIDQCIKNNCQAREIHKTASWAGLDDRSSSHQNPCNPWPLLSQYSYGKMGGGGWRLTGSPRLASEKSCLQENHSQIRGLSQRPGKCASKEREQARDVQRCAGLGTDLDNIVNRLDYQLIAVLGAQPWSDLSFWDRALLSGTVIKILTSVQCNNDVKFLLLFFTLSIRWNLINKF